MKSCVLYIFSNNMELFAVWVVSDNEDIDNLIEQLQEMKEEWFDWFVYWFWKNTQETRSVMVDALKLTS